jgi:hypothetical protein
VGITLNDGTPKKNPSVKKRRALVRKHKRDLAESLLGSDISCKMPDEELMRNR